MEPDNIPTTNATAALPARRGFFQWLALGLGAVASGLVAIPYVGYLLGPLKRPIDWVTLGPVTGFEPEATRFVTFTNPMSQPWDGMVAETGVFVRNLGKDERGSDQFLVLAANCAHL